MVRILHDDWSIGFGENRPEQSSQTFDGYANFTLTYRDRQARQNDSIYRCVWQWHAKELLSGGSDKRNLPMGLIEDS